ncbi:leucine-rich PPR motif-containing protein, mitochondrial [Coccinella septempunctata]|uniref:leucine-rich PPR motif-containing protein, mitochondrial n=1 Tax=Coccinella septempunctata TaxID=41139 RepID=UPI001D06A620|nr:leucine-rich PPR motif-containing protein, mitochondrial [Coccinella septempunctata]
MYHCLRFCQRFFNSFTLETVDTVIRHNRRIYSNGRIIPRYYNTVSSAFEEGRIIPKREVSSFDELLLYLSNQQRIQVEQMSQLFTTIKDDNLTEKQVLLLLDCCSNSIPSENIKTKHNLCEAVLKKFEITGKFSEKVYESYISICTKNKQCLDVELLISSLGNNITPNILKLILQNVCECGDNDKAFKVLAEMKNRQYVLDESVFNYLVLAHAIEGGLQSALNIVQTMNTAKLKESSETLFFIIKGLSQRKDLKEFNDALELYKISYSEDMILSLLESLGYSGNHAGVKLLTNLVDKTLLSRHFFIELEQLCINLVHYGKYDAAFEIYKTFVDVKPDTVYGGCILREMLLCSAPLDKIVEIADDLKQAGLNEYALENVTEAAMRNKLFSSALNLLAHFSTLKPHYFWPLLIEAHKRDGEIGLLEIVRSASEMNVKFDSESFETIILPLCNLRNPQRVLTMFKEIGYSVRELLTPMIIALLRRKDTTSALQLCDTYKDVKLNAEDILKSLPITWLSTGNHNGCLTLLQKISEPQSEIFLGKFLIDVLEKMRNTSRLKNFLALLREYKKRNLQISTSTADSLFFFLNGNLYLPDKKEELTSAINDLLDFSQIPTVQPFIHPRDMTIEQLELHLIELKSKGMETRGVLRKLIQKYAGHGNPERVRELRGELAAKGYSTSPGIKSAVLHSHVQEGDLEEALEIYEEIMTSCPYFKMDSFKIIDLARLLVKNDRLEKAVEILKRSAIQKESRQSIEAWKSWERNCVNLLKSARDIDEQNVIFKVLLDNGYCEPSNVILGAIIQLHLHKDTLENTVDLYVDFSKKYGKTPMHVVLLSEALEAGKDELLQRILDASAVVHGSTAARSALVAAMCEKGFVKQVVTILQGCSINPSADIERRCDRWVQMSNMKALQTLLEAAKELPSKLLNIPKIQLSIMRLYSKRNDCDGALKFWKELVDEEDHVDTEVDNEFCELLSRCKFNSPENLDMKYKLK